MKTGFLHMQKQRCRSASPVTAKLISAFVFAIRIVHFLYYIYPKISSLQPSSVALQPGFCRTWLETPKTGFSQRGLDSRIPLISFFEISSHSLVYMGALTTLVGNPTYWFSCDKAQKHVLSRERHGVIVQV